MKQDNLISRIQEIIDLSGLSYVSHSTKEQLRYGNSSNICVKFNFNGLFDSTEDISDALSRLILLLKYNSFSFYEDKDFVKKLNLTKDKSWNLDLHIKSYIQIPFLEREFLKLDAPKIRSHSFKDTGNKSRELIEIKCSGCDMFAYKHPIDSLLVFCAEDLSCNEYLMKEILI